MVITHKVFFPWKPEYSVLHPGIDSQHQRLVGLLNDLFAAMTEGQGRTAVQRTLTGLANYTKTHFSYEEQQMEKAGYPAMPQHQEQHRKLLQQVDRYVQNWNDDQSVSAVELGTFLKDWLLNHIGQTDLPLAEYLNPQG
jgi:hemerythrin-like metal-binding protein